MSTWYWKNAQNEDPQGPVTANELKKLAITNQIGRNYLVWKQGMGSWVPASKLKGLFDAPGAHASSAQGSTSDSTVHHSTGMYKKTAQQAAPWGTSSTNALGNSALFDGGSKGFKGENYEALPTFFSFRGRVRRTTYFLQSFGVFIGFLVFFVIIALMTGNLLLEDSWESSLFGFIFSLGLTIVHSFIFVKRLHDLNLSAWFYWINLIPLVNILFSLYVLFGRGSVGSNDYGPDPRS